MPLTRLLRHLIIPLTVRRIVRRTRTTLLNRRQRIGPPQRTTLSRRRHRTLSNHAIVQLTALLIGL
jgi:hypothetical protein